MRTHRHAVESVLEWLPHHGQQLTRLSLKLGLSSQLIRQLPCQHLLELKLLECDIQLGAADGFPGVIEGCSKLTRLELECNILDATERAVMDGLSSLVHLQHLVVAPAAHKRFAWQDEYVIAGLSGATLPRLQHLTCLKVNELSTENLLQLSILANLQELHLATGWLGKNISEVSGLVFPASLKTLVLFSEVEVEARVLSLVPPGLQDLRVDGGVGGPDEGPDSFLSCVSGLKHLTRLSLGGCNIVDWPVAGPAYSALTASSNLAVLEMYDPRFPPNIWPYVFAPTQKLPCLTSLYLWGSDGNEPLSPPPWSAADLSSIINCCPNLCELEIDNLEPGVRVSELHKLTTLTRLRLGHDALRSPAGFDGCVRDVASVTQLRQVQFSMYGLDVTAALLLPLTSLTALTSLTHDFGDQIQFSLRTSTQVGMLSHCWWCEVHFYSTSLL